MKLPTDLVAKLGSAYAGKSVCVTGGAGFIGGHLVDALISLQPALRRITVIDDLSNSTLDHLAEHIELEPDRVVFVHGSILDDDAVHQAVEDSQIVFHLAALGSVPRSLAEPQRTFSVNATGTVRVLEAARRLGAGRVVHSSSSSVYGESAAAIQAPKTESQQLLPASPYAASKVAAEAAVRAWCRSFGLSAVSLRYFNVFGPRQAVDSAYAAVIPAFTARLLAGQSPTIFGDGHQSRDFTPVACAVVANLLAGVTRNELNGQAVNIGLGHRTELIDLVRRLALQAGVPAIDPVFEPARAGDVRSSQADISLARALLDYQPVTTLEEAIAETVAFYKRQFAQT